MNDYVERCSEADPVAISTNTTIENHVYDYLVRQVTINDANAIEQMQSALRFALI